MTMSDEKVRGEQWHNRTSEYYLVSVKQRLEVEFRDSLKREKKRHAEPKAQGVILFEINKDGGAGCSWELAELLYLVKCSTESFGSIYRDELIKKIKDKYVEQEVPIPDIDDLIDEKEKKFNDGWW